MKNKELIATLFQQLLNVEEMKKEMQSKFDKQIADLKTRIKEEM